MSLQAPEFDLCSVESGFSNSSMWCIRSWSNWIFSTMKFTECPWWLQWITLLLNNKIVSVEMGSRLDCIILKRLRTIFPAGRTMFKFRRLFQPNGYTAVVVNKLWCFFLIIGLSAQHWSPTSQGHAWQPVRLGLFQIGTSFYVYAAVIPTFFVIRFEDLCA